MSAVQDRNGRRMLGLLCAESAAEAAGAADSLGSILTGMEPPALGEFFAGLGLEAAPGEIGCWEDADFLEVLLLSSDFDTSWISTEQDSTGAWCIRTKVGVFPDMLGDLAPAVQTGS